MLTASRAEAMSSENLGKNLLAPWEETGENIDIKRKGPVLRMLTWEISDEVERGGNLPDGTRC
jgi:hypothetical protein